MCAFPVIGCKEIGLLAYQVVPTGARTCGGANFLVQVSLGIPKGGLYTYNPCLLQRPK